MQTSIDDETFHANSCHDRRLSRQRMPHRASSFSSLKSSRLPKCSTPSSSSSWLLALNLRLERPQPPLREILPALEAPEESGDHSAQTIAAEAPEVEARLFGSAWQVWSWSPSPLAPGDGECLKAKHRTALPLAETNPVMQSW